MLVGMSPIDALEGGMASFETKRRCSRLVNDSVFADRKLTGPIRSNLGFRYTRVGGRRRPSTPFSTLRRIHTQARQPAQKGCSLADRQDRNVGRGIDRVHVSGVAAVFVRSLDPCFECDQHPFRGSLRRLVAVVRLLYHRPKATFYFFGTQVDMREHLPEESLSRRQHQSQCLPVIWWSGMEIFR